MKLASKRKTSSPKDRAYSLIGLLDICLRANYREGQAKALIRLFKEIIRFTDDISVFNWVIQYVGSTEPR
jgi:hypothetical protein